MSRTESFRGLDRRVFLRRSAAAGLALAGLAPQPRAAPGDRVVCAVIGVRGRGRSFYLPLAGGQDTTVAALCDVDANVLGPAGSAVEKAQGKAPRAVEDFRRVLDDRTIDAVFVATPHHWHSPIALAA